MEKVIFLDFDGVLNTRKYQDHLKADGERRADEFGLLFDPDAVENLRKIVEAVPDVYIVINSTWKYDGLDTMRTMWKKRGLPGAIHSITPSYVPDFSTFIPDDMSIDMLAGKGYDIKQWIEDYTPKGCHYVILDDDHRILPEQMPHLIQIDGNVGLTEEDSIRVIKMLS